MPPNCSAASGACPTGGATANGTYPYVFNNVLYDPAFGITSQIYLDQVTVFGQPINSIPVPSSALPGAGGDQMVTSFSSKSEIALQLSTDGNVLSFMGYVAPIDAIDVSNSSTPMAPDPTNPDGQTPAYRAVASIGLDNQFHFTETNAYSGNNGRAVILNNSYGNPFFYTAGNAGNGSNPQPNGVVLGAGAQSVVPSLLSEAAQAPGLPTPVASFSVAELGQKADKVGKDDNFRGETIFNNVLYYSKDSGSNGVNTVYFVDTVGTACPSGTGLPVAGAKLPTAPLSYDPSTLQSNGLPSNMCILAGFPTTLAKNSTGSYPASLWFANATTLYVADEGDAYTGGSDLYTHAAAQTTAGLQKWVLSASTHTWQHVYTLQNGLGLGTPYTVAGYPTGNNTATGLPWAPATDGLRNITGLVGPDGVAVIWAITATVSGGGDLGADPNKLVVLYDLIGNTDASVAAGEPGFDFKDAKFGEVLRGVSFTPGSDLGFFQNQ
ncbi:hypothetical protein D1Y84_11280 [Acidipila sp. EB88]|nr:hypothetical protein D1Y84_11280 [Acidipila sp. EB88]